MAFPVVVICYNRPDLLKITLDAVVNYSPSKLYVFNDGPRNHLDYVQIQENLHLVQRLHVSFTIETFFSKKNLGAKANIERALNYFFSKESFGIVLEDDCVPTEDFFDFVAMIRAEQLQHGKTLNPISGIRFKSSKIASRSRSSRLPHIWGWACSSDYWSLFPKNENETRDLYENFLTSRFFLFPGEKFFFKENLKRFSSYTHGYIDYNLWVINKLFARKFIIPPYSLVRNLGFDDRATNTAHSRLQNLLMHKTSSDASLSLQKPSFFAAQFRFLYDFSNFVFCQLMHVNWYNYFKYIARNYLHRLLNLVKRGFCR